MTADAGLRDLLARGDLDGLVREVDRRSGRGDWRAVLALRDACLVATEETGRQLWGPARYAAYRVALEGPAALAAGVLEPGVARFGLGPLTEVVAQDHRFAELADRLDATLRPVVAQERVLRGEDLRGDPRAVSPDPDAPPLVLQPFEPAYTLPTYRAAERIDGAPVLRPAPPTPVHAASGEAGPTPPPSASAPTGAPPWSRAVAAALRTVVEVWETASDARVATVALGGATARDAARVVAPDLADLRPIGVGDLLALLAFAGASGGVHGPRRGGAAGRAAAWWVARVAAVPGGPAGAGGPHDADAPLDPDELEYRLEDLELVTFATPGAVAWRLQVALADPTTGAAAAISAVEAAGVAEAVAGQAPAEGTSPSATARAAASERPDTSSFR